MSPPFPLYLPQISPVKFPSILLIYCQLLLFRTLLAAPTNLHLKLLGSSLITSVCVCGGWWGWRRKPHITSCIYLSRVASEWHGEWSWGWKVKDSGVNESWPKPKGWILGTRLLKHQKAHNTDTKTLAYLRFERKSAKTFHLSFMWLLQTNF